MNMLCRRWYATGVRLRRHATRPAGDRGDNPVPTAVIIGGLVALAITLLLGLYALTELFLDQAPTELPEPEFGE